MFRVLTEIGLAQPRPMQPLGSKGALMPNEFAENMSD
jgi:hypothetical protein